MPTNTLQRAARTTAVTPLLRPLFAIGVAAILSTAAALVLPPVAAAILAAVAVLLLLIPSLRRGGRWVILLTAALFLLRTAGYTYLHVAPMEALAGQTDTFHARVVETPKSGTMYTVEITDSTRLPVGTRVSLYCGEGVSFAPHDTITASVTLETVTYSRTNLYSKGVYLCAFPTDKWGATVTLTGTATPPWALRLRGWFDTQLRQVLPAEEGDLLAALCLGDRRAVSDAVDDAFRNSGLSHLLVVSGLHLSMVAVALRGLLRRLGGGYRTAAVLTVPLIGLFAVMTGGTNSVLRAWLMCSLWLMSFVIYRRYDGLTAWGMAAAVLLFAHPYRLLNAGFQLSFAATAGVLMLAPRLCRTTRRETPPATLWTRVRATAGRYIRNGCGVCVAALLFTLPLSVYYFGGFSLTALPANLLAVIPAGWALTIGWLGMLVGGVPLLGWVSRPLLMVAGCLARYLQTVAALCGPDGAFLPTPYGWQKVLIAVVCVLTICGILWKIPWRRVAASVAALCVATCALCLPLTLTTPQVTVIPAARNAAVLVQYGGRSALWVSHSAALEDALWTLDERGCTRLQDLFIAAGASGDGGTLAALTQQVRVDAIHTPHTDWCAGLPITVQTCTDGESHPLWGGLTLTADGNGLWRLDIRGADALLVADPTAVGTDTAALTVYAGCPDTLPRAGACVVTCRAVDIPKMTDVMTDSTILLTDDPITLTTRNGQEWSVLSWL